MDSDSKSMARDVRAPLNIAYVLCVESGWLEPQSVMLAQSIRRFAGKYSDRPIIAVKPRAGEALLPETIASFRELDVTYLDIDLNVEMRENQYANKVFACAHVEEAFDFPYLLFLDTDTFFLGEPTFLDCLNERAGLFRPVDLRGICGSPEDNKNSSYWGRLCSLAGISLESLPVMRSFVDRSLIRTNFNGGFLAVKADLGIFREWRELSVESWRQRLFPKPGDSWGWDQATFCVSVHSRSTDYQLLPRSYNYPLHCHDQLLAENLGREITVGEMVHCHYHWLFEPERLEGNPLLTGSMPCDPVLAEFINEFSAHPVTIKAYATGSRRVL